jgi:hypothetical protein
MSETAPAEPRTRRERLRAIAAAYTEEIYDPATAAQIRGAAPVSRFAAVTSEGSVESSHASNGNLLVAEEAGRLAELLRQECGEGWLAHGRAWDLDAPWHPAGNLEAAYSVAVGEDSARQVHVVVSCGRQDGVHLFDDIVDARAFEQAVRRRGGEATRSECPLNDNRAADRLIEAEARR